MNHDNLINGTIKFVLAFGITLFLLVKGALDSNMTVQIDGEKVKFSRVYVIEDEPKNNIFIERSSYNLEEVKKFAGDIGARLYFMDKEKKECEEKEAFYLALKIKNETK